jgi:hypothetical protein
MRTYQLTGPLFILIIFILHGQELKAQSQYYLFRNGVEIFGPSTLDQCKKKRSDYVAIDNKNDLVSSLHGVSSKSYIKGDFDNGFTNSLVVNTSTSSTGNVYEIREVRKNTPAQNNRIDIDNTTNSPSSTKSDFSIKQEQNTDKITQDLMQRVDQNVPIQTEGNVGKYAPKFGKTVAPSNKNTIENAKQKFKGANTTNQTKPKE